MYMNLDELKEWMRYEWNFSTHPKYRHLFEEWWKNALPSQLEYFNEQMHRLKNNVLGKTSGYFKNH